MAISTNQKPTIYRNLYENTGPAHLQLKKISPERSWLKNVELICLQSYLLACWVRQD